uniref:Transmembrane protein 268 n=1 Tax=Clastoptera arizonana TaxID=38151 RepID=A0A1B6DHH4_9HEMI
MSSSTPPKDITETSSATISAPPVKKWVQFEDDERRKSQPDTNDPQTRFENGEQNGGEMPLKVPSGGQYSGAVISTESVHISLDRGNVNRSFSAPENPTDVTDTVVNMRNVDLNNAQNGNTGTGIIRQGFANGDLIVTLLPVNTSLPWITPAKFRPELVPEELMAQGLTLTVEDYVHIMEVLTNDVRFTMYNICYKRVLVMWIFTSFIVLLALLFSGLSGLTLFGLGVIWLVFNAAAIFFCMWIKIKLNHNLEKCMGNVNKHLMRHKIILGLDDRGKISCHKVNLCFIYFDTSECIKKLQEVIEKEEAEGRPVNREETQEEKKNRIKFAQRMDIEDQDIIIQGSNTTRLSRKQERATLLFLRYSSRWVKLFVRQRLDLCIDGRSLPTVTTTPPRHCVSSRCPCQFIEEHLKYKPRGKLTLRQIFCLPDFPMK